MSADAHVLGWAVSQRTHLVTPASRAATCPSWLRDAGVKDTAVARVDGELRDLAYVVAEGELVEQVPYGSEDGRAVLRHSAAHVLAQAVQELFPGTLLGIGPPIKDGFYYDFARAGRSRPRTSSPSRRR